MRRARPGRRAAAALLSISGALFAPTPSNADAPPFEDALRLGFRSRLLGSTAKFIDLDDPRVRVSVAPTFLWVRDLSLSLPGPPWMDEGPFLEAFDLARAAWEQTGQPSDVRALAVFVTFDVGPTAPFYAALANDVEGIGERVFDDTPGSELEGLIWMGELAELWEAGPGYYEEAFIHEVAHRWTVYVDIDHPRLEPGALRGRQDRHWSFLADTANSPMDGNDWVESDLGRETLFFTPHEPIFSPLDLYLMGHRAAADVAPFELIRSFDDSTPSWVNVNPSTLPAHRLDVTVELEGVATEQVTIDHILQAEGPRAPAAGPNEWPIGVVLLSSGFAGAASLDDRRRFEATLDDMVARYATATGDAMSLRVTTTDPGTADMGAACASDRACNPARSDGCDPVRGVCAQSCRRADDCGTGQGCCDGWCAPIQICPRVEADAGATDAGPDTGPIGSPDAGASDAGMLDEEPGSCAATGVLPWLLLPLGRWARRSTPRRRARSLDA